MYKTIIGKIQTIFTGISAVKEVYPYPLDGSPKKYPAIIWFPDNFDNRFDNNGDNFKILKFKIFLVVNLAGTDENTVFTSILPDTADAVIAEFDSKWSATLGGRRMWYILDTGLWSISEEQKAKTAILQMTLTVKFSTEV